MNHEIEFTRFACSRSKFSTFSLKKKRMFQLQDYFKQEIRFKGYVIIVLKKPLSSTSCLPTDPTRIFSFLALVTEKVEEIRTMSREERHTENLFLGFYNVV